ncbi:MAG: hypothetical protein L6428_13810 [Candidatus Aminicenantes bacterium]|nr:hypothetical protein [Candidatus Aminicenantes bacterium]
MKKNKQSTMLNRINYYNEKKIDSLDIDRFQLRFAPSPGTLALQAIVLGPGTFPEFYFHYCPG